MYLDMILILFDNVLDRENTKKPLDCFSTF